MGTLSNMIESWAKMGFQENPYGDHIPNKYLYDQRVMHIRKTLGECKQDGNVLDIIHNGHAKTSPAETEETVKFSEVFQRLESANKLCPSNYIVEVIRDLEKWDAEHNTRHDDDFFCKTIARSLRTFASLLRERNLREIIDDSLHIATVADIVVALFYLISIIRTFATGNVDGWIALDMTAALVFTIDAVVFWKASKRPVDATIDVDSKVAER